MFIHTGDKFPGGLPPQTTDEKQNLTSLLGANKYSTKRTADIEVTQKNLAVS